MSHEWETMSPWNVAIQHAVVGEKKYKIESRSPPRLHYSYLCHHRAWIMICMICILSLWHYFNATSSGRGGEGVMKWNCMLTHGYPHKPPRKYNVILLHDVSTKLLCHVPYTFFCFVLFCFAMSHQCVAGTDANAISLNIFYHETTTKSYIDPLTIAFKHNLG